MAEKYLSGILMEDELRRREEAETDFMLDYSTLDCPRCGHKGLRMADDPATEPDLEFMAVCLECEWIGPRELNPKDAYMSVLLLPEGAPTRSPSPTPCVNWSPSVLRPISS